MVTLRAQAPTYAKDIAPILRANCVSCHRPGESGPFPLLTYEDAKKRARLIAEVTARRFMPPWLPQPGYGDFEGARRLTDAEIKTIAEWAAAGAPEGEAPKGDARKPPYCLPCPTTGSWASPTSS